MIKKRMCSSYRSVHTSEDEARKLLITLVPKDAKLQATIFDTATGEVSFGSKTSVVDAENSSFSHEVSEKIWILRMQGYDM